MPKISTSLWFDKNAEEAVTFYTSVFKNSKILKTARYTSAGPLPEGTVMTIDFELDGQPFLAINGGPEFKFSEAISLCVECKSQQEVDDYWAKLLSGGGEESVCGWLKDRYGLSWQVTPTALRDMISDPDKAKAKRVAEAMFKMRKIDIAKLKEAYEGRKAA